MFTLYIGIFLKHKKLGVKSKIMGMFGTWSDGLVVKVWLRCWISNPGVPCSKPLGGFKVNLAFHPSDVDKMSARNIWELSGKK